MDVYQNAIQFKEILVISNGDSVIYETDESGNIYINRGTINITATSPFDYDGTAKLSGGTIYVNGTQTNTITNSMMGGGNMNGGMHGQINPNGGGMQGQGRR